jgi:dTDP-4-amino-4,6-dideoxygalactose transaminase
MLVCDDDELAARVRVRSLHGLDKDAWKRYSATGLGTYTIQYPGFKYNMTDIQASLGIHQLARIESALDRRGEIWDRYNEGFHDLEGIEVPPASLHADESDLHAKHLYTLWFDWDRLGMDRQQLMVELRNAGVGTGWHFPALHLQEFYSTKYGILPGSFPVAESIAERTLSLPLSGALHDSEVERVVASVRALVGQYV